MQDHLPTFVQRRAVFVIVNAARDHRRIDVAPQELDKHQITLGGDAGLAHALRSHWHLCQHEAGVAQDDGAGVVVLVAVAGMRMLFLHDG